MAGQVAEEREDVDVVPRLLEVAEVELEVVRRDAVHARNPAVPVGVFPEAMAILLVE